MLHTNNMKYLYFIPLVILLISLFLFRIGIYLKQDENTDIRVKIGQILCFKLNNKKIIETCQRISKYDITLLKTNQNKQQINELFKYITINKITVINQNNILNNLWNVYIPISYQIFNRYLDQTLTKNFKKVNNKYYSIEYTTIGSYKLKFEIDMSIRVYKLVEYFIINLIKKKKVRYDKSN